MKYTSEIVSNLLFIALEGDILGESGGMDLVEIATKNIENGIKNGIVELSQARYMNSTGIGILITLLTKFKNAGGTLVLVQPSSQLIKLLAITKLDSVFTIVTNKQEAIDLLSK